jgi:predicted ATP pyrophosphatase (TIGR00289 family)
MRIASLCSGGKDSAYALWLAMLQGHEVKHLIAMIPMRGDSWMFHRPNVHLIDLFAECVGIPAIKAETTGEKEHELEDLKKVLQTLDVQAVVSGTISSIYQKDRIDRICRELRLSHIAPIWSRDPMEVLGEMVNSCFEAIITSVSAEGLDESWLGRKIDRKCLEDLHKVSMKFGVNPAGEGGEYESLVLDAPFFRKRIEILKAEPVWKGDRGYLLIKRARSVCKHKREEACARL